MPCNRELPKAHAGYSKRRSPVQRALVEVGDVGSHGYLLFLIGMNVLSTRQGQASQRQKFAFILTESQEGQIMERMVISRKSQP